MRPERVPDDVARIHERVQRLLDADVDADAVWTRVTDRIDRGVVVPLRNRRGRRSTAWLLVATLAIGGSALAGVVTAPSEPRGPVTTRPPVDGGTNGAVSAEPTDRRGEAGIDEERHETSDGDGSGEQHGERDQDGNGQGQNEDGEGEAGGGDETSDEIGDETGDETGSDGGGSGEGGNVATDDGNGGDGEG